MVLQIGILPLNKMPKLIIFFTHPPTMKVKYLHINFFKIIKTFKIYCIQKIIMAAQVITIPTLELSNIDGTEGDSALNLQVPVPSVFQLSSVCGYSLQASFLSSKLVATAPKNPFVCYVGDNLSYY
jgi:hypothetical protein